MLIRHGHPGAFDYTPREVAGWLTFDQAVQKREMAMRLSYETLAARGDPKEVKKALKELQKE